jgi:hypothetical protein
MFGTGNTAWCGLGNVMDLNSRLEGTVRETGNGGETATLVDS